MIYAIHYVNARGAHCIDYINPLVVDVVSRIKRLRRVATIKLDGETVGAVWRCYDRDYSGYHRHGHWAWYVWTPEMERQAEELIDAVDRLLAESAR